MYKNGRSVNPLKIRQPIVPLQAKLHSAQKNEAGEITEKSG
jgi:hypothetical protein